MSELEVQKSFEQQEINEQTTRYDEQWKTMMRR